MVPHLVARADELTLDHEDVIYAQWTGEPDIEDLVIKVRLPGLRGGGFTDEQIRSRILSCVPAGVDPAKADETISKVPRPELLKWMSNPSWTNLKVLVGQKVTYVERRKPLTDPLQERDPWMAAIQNKPNRSGPRTKPAMEETNKENASMTLIADIFRNEDGSTPGILPRLQHGCTGIILMRTDDFGHWMDIKPPMSPDELGVVVFPPLEHTPKDIPSQEITFPALLTGSNGTKSTTLVKGNLSSLEQNKSR